MPRFQVTIADAAGHKLYDESIEAVGPREACSIAAKESATAEAPEHLAGPPVMTGQHSSVEESLE